MFEKLKEKIDEIRWEYFTNQKSGIVAQACLKEFNELHDILKEL